MSPTAKARQSQMKKTHDRLRTAKVRSVHIDAVREIKGTRTVSRCQCPYCGCLVANKDEHCC